MSQCVGEHSWELLDGAHFCPYCHCLVTDWQRIIGAKGSVSGPSVDARCRRCMCSRRGRAESCVGSSRQEPVLRSPSADCM